MTKRDRYAQQLGQEPELGQMPTQADIFYPTPAPIPPRRSTGGLALKDGEVQIGVFRLTANGLEIGGDATRDEWHKVGDLLFKLQGSIQWLIGDWLAYGLNLQYGDIPKLADYFDRDEKTLHHYKQICEKFEFTRRRVDLTFGHHEAVRALLSDEQDVWLAYAAEKGLSVAALRKELQGRSTPALSTGFDADKSYKAMKKLSLRDPVTLKPQERDDAREHLLQIERWITEMRHRLEIE